VLAYPGNVPTGHCLHTAAADECVHVTCDVVGIGTAVDEQRTHPPAENPTRSVDRVDADVRHGFTGRPENPGRALKWDDHAHREILVGGQGAVVRTSTGHSHLRRTGHPRPQATATWF